MESITLNQKRYSGVHDAKLYIYPKLLEEVDMKIKKCVKSKRIQNFSSQEVNMVKKKKLTLKKENKKEFMTLNQKRYSLLIQFFLFDRYLGYSSCMSSNN